METEETDQAKNILDHREKLFFARILPEETYKEMEISMGINRNGVESIRDKMFAVLGLKSKVGLAVWAVTNKLILR